MKKLSKARAIELFSQKIPWFNKESEKNVVPVIWYDCPEYILLEKDNNFYTAYRLGGENVKATPLEKEKLAFYSEITKEDKNLVRILQKEGFFKCSTGLFYYSKKHEEIKARHSRFCSYSEAFRLAKDKCPLKKEECYPNLIPLKKTVLDQEQLMWLIGVSKLDVFYVDVVSGYLESEKLCLGGFFCGTSLAMPDDELFVM